MSCYYLSAWVMMLAMSKPVVLPQASGNTSRASGLVVMTSRLQRGGRRFNSGLAHFHLLLERLSRLSKNTGGVDNPSWYKILSRGVSLIAFLMSYSTA